MMGMLRMAALMMLLAARRADAADTASPNDAIAKPDCDSTIAVSFRYTPESEGFFVESEDDTTRGGCVTLTEIWEWLGGSAPLYAVDPASGDVSSTATGTWLLTENLSIEDGITLKASVFSICDRYGCATSVRVF